MINHPCMNIVIYLCICWVRTPFDSMEQLDKTVASSFGYMHLELGNEHRACCMVISTAMFRSVCICLVGFTVRHQEQLHRL